MTVKLIQNRQNDRVFARIEGIEKLTKRGLRQGMFKGGQTLISEVSRSILNDPKTGVVYIRRDSAGRRRRHQSSAAGETHANLSGALRRSRSFQLRGSSEIEFGYGVSSGKSAPAYARAIEFGFRPRNLEARPTLRNALNSQQGNLISHFEREIARALK